MPYALSIRERGLDGSETGFSIAIPNLGTFINPMDLVT